MLARTRASTGELSGRYEARFEVDQIQSCVPSKLERSGIGSNSIQSYLISSKSMRKAEQIYPIMARLELRRRPKSWRISVREIMIHKHA